VDADGDGVVAGIDCDDSNRAAHTAVAAYLDADGDGVGADAPLAFCTAGAPPPGHAVEGGDCAPDDPSRWRGLAEPLVDRDLDGFTAIDAQPVCLGETTPPPYAAAPRGRDCDDADAARHRWVTLYADADGDGVGAGPRQIAWSCEGATLPAGTSPLGWDVDDADPAVTAEPDTDAAVARLLD